MRGAEDGDRTMVDMLNYMKNGIQKSFMVIPSSITGILLVVVLLLRAKPKTQRKEESGDRQEYLHDINNLDADAVILGR